MHVRCSDDDDDDAALLLGLISSSSSSSSSLTPTRIPMDFARHMHWLLMHVIIHLMMMMMMMMSIGDVQGYVCLDV